MPGVLKGVKHGDPITVYRGEKVLYIARKLSSKAAKQASVDLAIDLFYTLYLPYPIVIPASKVTPELERNYYIIKALVDSEEIHELKKYSIANSLSSTLLSASLIEYIGKELDRELGFGEGVGEEGREEKGRNAISRAVKRALKNVLQEAATLKKIEKLIGTGHEAGKGTAMDLDESGEEVIKLARNADIRELLEVLTLIPDVTKRLKKKYDRFSRGEFRGYDVGSDLERIVPTELTLPRIYFRVKYLESKLLLYEKVLPKSSGPIYLLTDKSGSMDGEKIKWAKATSIALLIKSRREHRDFYMRFFDGVPHNLVRIPKRMKPSDVISFIKYLSRVKGGGGTDITKAIVTACDDIKSGAVRGTSDIVIITDGEDNVSERIIRRKLKLANARLITVMIIGENRDLRRASDSYLRALHLSKDEILKVVEA